jgi:signal transduction histidine kinase
MACFGVLRYGMTVVHEFPIVAANMPASAEHRRLALIVICVLLAIALIAAPFADVQLPRVNAFIPVLQTVLCLADILTAILLFAQYSIQPRTAILALASGYVTSGLFSFLQTLAFPGAYAPQGVIGDGANSPAWLFVLWHTAFPLGVLVYAFLKDAGGAPGLTRQLHAKTIGATIASILLVNAGLAWLATNGTTYLPTMYGLDLLQQTTFAKGINVFLCLWGMTALVVLFIRRRTILDLWLIVTLIAWMPNFLVAIFITTVRFSVIWYLARCYALVASFIVLTVLLTETMLLYSKLASAIQLQGRERMGRLMSLEAATGAIAHELGQELTAIGLHSRAAALCLKNASPNWEKVGEHMHYIDDATEQAANVIKSIRALFRGKRSQRANIVIDHVAQQALTLAQHDLQVNQVSVRTDYHGKLPTIEADPIQLQQVVLNLIKNAIEAMSATAPTSRAMRISTDLGTHSNVLLLLEDTGPGLAADTDRIFEPFVTTKADGMGLGLVISRAIIEGHKGTLRVVKTGSHGTIFEIALPLTADLGVAAAEADADDARLAPV